MLTYIFRAKYGALHWRPKNITDLLNAKLVRIWLAKPNDAKLENIAGRE